MKLSAISLAAGVILSIGSVCFAQAEVADLPAPPPVSADAKEPAMVLRYPHPVPPADAPWAGATVMLIIGMFAAAAAVGVVVRANAPVEVPGAHSHDDSHGHDDHGSHGGDHGHGGHGDSSGGHH